MMLDSYTSCLCGAITVYDADGSAYSAKKKNLKKFFPGIDLRKLKRYPSTFCCDHCVNHYGLDLCGCGSGEPFGKCDNDLPECSMTMQAVGFYTAVRGANAFV